MGIKKILKTLYEDVVVENLPKKRKWKTWDELSKEEKQAWGARKDMMKGINKKTTQFYPKEKRVTLIEELDGTKRAIISTHLSCSNPEYVLKVFKTENYTIYYMGNEKIDKEEFQKRMDGLEKNLKYMLKGKKGDYTEMATLDITIDSKAYDVENIREEDGEIKFDII